MSSGWLVTAEMAITVVVVLGWGFWELYKLKKGR